MRFFNQPLVSLFSALFTLLACTSAFAQSNIAAKPLSTSTLATNAVVNSTVSTPHEANEKHLKNTTQLTFGGDNAEAYFNPAGTQVSCQITNPKWNVPCDQIYVMDLAKAQKQDTANYHPQRISSGKGRTTCSYFMPDGKHILYASTFATNDACPVPPVSNGRYLWAVYPEFDIYVANMDGTIAKKLTDSPGYDAEATISPDGKTIVFTSIRSGDLELWTMDIDGKNVKTSHKWLRL